MPSPFPGMDPWLERHCGDVHQAVITYARDQIRAGLPKGLVARMQDRVYVEHLGGAERSVYPDIRVVEYPRKQRTSQPVGTGVAIAEPLLVRMPNEPIRESFIEIIDPAAGTRVVTVVEVLSPGNKVAGEGQRLYLEKQRELADGGVSLVEIDLLRAGQRVLNARPEQIRLDYRTTYQICVRRGYEPEISEVYRAPLRERLPPIPVPLRPSDPDVPLDLQLAVERAYENGDYDASIDYTTDPDPPLLPDDAAWADALLRSKGLR